MKSLFSKWQSQQFLAISIHDFKHTILYFWMLQQCLSKNTTKSFGQQYVETDNFCKINYFKSIYLHRGILQYD